MSENEPVVELPTSPRQQYLDFCAEGKLAYQYSASTRKPVFYPRTVAPGTGAADLEWRISSGRGSVYATSVVRRRGEEPENVAIVELEEGFRLMTAVIGVPPADVSIGMKVRVVFQPVGGDRTPLPVFVGEAAS